MAIIQGNAKQGSTRGFYPKIINGSLRFNDDDLARLEWTPDSAGNRKTWTLSMWVKRGNIGIEAPLWYGSPSGTYDEIRFETNDTLNIYSYSGAYQWRLATTQVFRDPSAWYHFVVALDTTVPEVKFYVNGEQVTAFSTNTQPSTNYEGGTNNTAGHGIAMRSDGTGNEFDGYLANVHFIDGQALTASDFGETKNGVWVAKNYAGTFGTNGFYLTFEDDTQVEAFNTVLYRGNVTAGGTGVNSVTGTGFQPDLVWIKSRGTGDNHNLFDSVRGVSKRLGSNLTSAEATVSYFTSFDSDGFTITGDPSGSNRAGYDYVAWCWKAGDSNVSNTDGTITSTVRANDTYGFSIVSYTGNGSAATTVGHGLSAAPDFFIVKNRIDLTNWIVWHKDLSANQWLKLETTDSVFTNADAFGATPSSTTITLGSFNSTNGSGDAMIAYCWSETTGYSKFGSYEGNASTSGPSVTCGFRPSVVIIKGIDSTPSWYILDSTRDTDGKIGKELYPNLSNAEGDNTAGDISFSDTGFQIITASSGLNANAETFIYAAFADTREAAFWLDQSGNDNDWQPVNLDHNDTLLDSPTNNFATLNPLNKGSAITLKDGNLSFTQSATWNGVTGTVGVSSGQWYFEYTYGGGTGGVVGVAKPTYNPSTEPGIADTVWRYRADDGTKRNGGASSSAYGATWTTGDVIGVAYDLDAGTLEFYKNGVSQGVAFTNLAGETVVPVAGTYSSSSASYINFGQQPFKYDPPA